jgi:hypothetical protein
MTTFTGDILLKNVDGNLDIEFVNGQTVMTDGLESLVIIAVFGEDNFQNDLTADEDKKTKSDFPGVIRRGLVDEKTKNDGTKAIDNALARLTRKNIAKKVTVTGEIFSVYGIGWEIIIERPDGDDVRFQINWERGSLTMNYAA